MTFEFSANRSHCWHRMGVIRDLHLLQVTGGFMQIEMQSLAFILVPCGLAGAYVANGKQAALSGFLLGIIFGPFGLIAAGYLDNRLLCRRCGGRQNGTTENPYPVCEHCGCENPKQKVAPVSRSSWGPTDEAPWTPATDVTWQPLKADDAWQASLDEAARKLEAAGLVKQSD